MSNGGKGGGAAFLLGLLGGAIAGYLISRALSQQKKREILCPNCQQPIQIGINKCPHCGIGLGWE
jgi:prepilin signal peptidase PulO-like enzyme (type II secretory pathway)